MKLYICFGTGGDPGHHMCAKAYHALKDAGHAPEIVKVYGSGYLPGFLQTKGRRKLKTMTGKYMTPVLELDNDTVIFPSDEIVTWAKANTAKS